MTKQNDGRRNEMQVIDMESIIPKDHLVRKVDAVIDFEFVRPMVKDLYSADNGRPSIDPVVLIKIVFIFYQLKKIHQANFRSHDHFHQFKLLTKHA